MLPKRVSEMSQQSGLIGELEGRTRKLNVGRMRDGLLIEPFGNGTRSGRSVSCEGREPRLNRS